MPSRQDPGRHGESNASISQDEQKEDKLRNSPAELEQAATRIQTAYRGYLASSARSVHDLGLMQEAKWATEALSGHGTQETDLPSGVSLDVSLAQRETRLLVREECLHRKMIINEEKSDLERLKAALYWTRNGKSLHAFHLYDVIHDEQRLRMNFLQEESWEFSSVTADIKWVLAEKLDFTNAWNQRWYGARTIQLAWRVYKARKLYKRLDAKRELLRQEERALARLEFVEQSLQRHVTNTNAPAAPVEKPRMVFGTPAKGPSEYAQLLRARLTPLPSPATAVADKLSKKLHDSSLSAASSVPSRPDLSSISPSRPDLTSIHEHGLMGPRILPPLKSNKFARHLLKAIYTDLHANVETVQQLQPQHVGSLLSGPGRPIPSLNPLPIC
jgi:hypothetical protein|mmetsp:Transcript_99954/g.168733  ORF Transcript_99954/g.168733 Transcript_99954/m.168733 type:complete len:387 (-) Transcript_99954:2480-3640(-)